MRALIAAVLFVFAGLSGAATKDEINAEVKEAVGNSLALVNLEYGLGSRRGPKLFGFYDMGRVGVQQGLANGGTPWLKGLGWGLGAGDFRVDFGYRVDAVPSSLQVLLRFGRTF